MNQWPIHDDLKSVIEKNPVEGIIDFDEFGDQVIVDRFKSNSEDESCVLIEITRSLLKMAPIESATISSCMYRKKEMGALEETLGKRRTPYICRIFNCQGPCVSLTVYNNG